MRIQTILNQLEQFKAFVYGATHLEKQGKGLALVVQIRPRKNSKPICPGCGRRGVTAISGGVGRTCSCTAR